MTNLLPDRCFASGCGSRKGRLNLSAKRIRDFKWNLRIVEQSSHGFSGLEKLLTLGAVTQVLFHQDIAAATSSSLSI